MTRQISTLFRGTPTAAEERAIKTLARALAQVPEGLSLFGWAGTLCVYRDGDLVDGELRPLAQYTGIHCDGGDPQDAGDPE